MSFTSFCSPNLQLDSLGLKINGPDFKINANGAYVTLCVGIISKSE